MKKVLKMYMAQRHHLDDAFLILQAAYAEWQLPVPWTKAQLLDEILHPDAQVWLLNTPVKAFLAARRFFDECWVMEVATHPQFFRQGSARKLLQNAQTWAYELRLPLWLEVHVENYAAIALYKKNGFTEQGLRKKYYPPVKKGDSRGDALQMCWQPSTPV